MTIHVLYIKLVIFPGICTYIIIIIISYAIMIGNYNVVHMIIYS